MHGPVCNELETLYQLDLGQAQRLALANVAILCKIFWALSFLCQ